MQKGLIIGKNMESIYIFFKLLLIAVFPVFASLVFYRLNYTSYFQNMSYQKKQIIFGVIFGIITALATEFGVDTSLATINVRDASPICAGLFFGGPAGILAGLIGGIHRWLAVYWGAGMYTRVACTIATILAGLVAAAFRKYMFDNKIPKWYYACGIAVLIETLHMLMVFLTNMFEVRTAFKVVEAASIPMIFVNGLAVAVAGFIIKRISQKNNKRQQYELKNISQSFIKGLSVVVFSGFLVFIAFSWQIQTQLSNNDANEILNINIKDIKSDITYASDTNLLLLAHMVTDRINSLSRESTITNEILDDLKNEFDITEINIINESGIIVNSTVKDYIGFDMGSGEQSAEFLRLLDERHTEMVQDYRPTSYDSSVYSKYAGVTLNGGGFVQVAYNAERFQKDIDKQVVGKADNRHIGERGYLIILNEKKNVITGSKNNVRSYNSYFSNTNIDQFKESKCYLANVFGETSYFMYEKNEGYYIIAVIPLSQALFTRNVSIYISVLLQIVVFGAIFVLVSFMIKHIIIDNIRKINKSLSEITGGNLDIVVDVRSNQEFASLSEDINSTVLALKGYITEAADRINKELEFARSIQHSALPSIFPPYPDRKDFEIYATMDAAKEVGGDFYDFYFVGNDKLSFLIADVSGKGIPAAMFMMTSKTLIKGYMESGLDVNEAFIMANNRLCENNEANMFVTAWIGAIDLKTGMVEFANAGHNPPLVKHHDGSFEYLKSRPGFVLAGMDGVKYCKNTLQLEPGDELYLYTDGVTEATDSNNCLYGEDRLLNFLNSLGEVSSEVLCKAVKEDIDKFVGDAPQFDDITMVSFKYFGERGKKRC